MKKEIGIIGLGRMGGGLAQNLIDHKWKVVGYNRTEAVTRELEKVGLTGAFSLQELVEKLPKPRVIILMLTADGANDKVLFDKNGLASLLEKGDIVIDGGNSYYKQAIDRGKKLGKNGIKFVDAGISGGPGGARNGACCMVGGDDQIFTYIEPIFKDISIPKGYMHFTGVGAGHFVKMVHNGIEYGMMQSIAEGFEIMNKSPFKLNLIDVAEIYQHGSVVTSRLVGWLQDAFKKYGQELEDVSGSVGFTGEGEWTAATAREFKVPAKIIEESFKFRVASQKKPSFTGKLLTGMRNQFGHHSIEKGKMT
ncbi:MAG: decarboxylating 6-phosphogluconate dehydrogenase [Candidatus Levybacteria bacterium]|nr:decarboxylating 6-phosphogluconate dehydrogenase [Candidatus Levybacteria bacterium]